MTIIVRQVTPGTIRVTSHRDSIIVGRIELSLTEARTLAHDLLAATDTGPAPTPAPEGFDVFAHWSAVHAGVNVEIDAPDGLPLTVHVNDWQAVNIVIGTDHETEEVQA